MCEICEAMARGEDIDADVKVVKLELPNAHEMSLAEFVGRMAIAMSKANAPAEVIAEVVSRGEAMHAKMLAAGKDFPVMMPTPGRPTRH